MLKMLRSGKRVWAFYSPREHECDMCEQKSEESVEAALQANCGYMLCADCIDWFSEVLRQSRLDCSDPNPSIPKG